MPQDWCPEVFVCLMTRSRQDLCCEGFGGVRTGVLKGFGGLRTGVLTLRTGVLTGLGPQDRCLRRLAASALVS